MSLNNLSVQAARLRSAIISNVRDFFRSRDVLEIETPVLSPSASTDCFIDLFSTRYHPDGYTDCAKSETLFLQTSPEFYMKRLLSNGFPDLFQICKVFRNGECGRLHNPEFTMLEWYRRGYDMFELIDEVAQLCITILGPRPVYKQSYHDLFLQLTGINPLATDLAQLNEFCRVKGLDLTFGNETDALQFIMAQIIEPQLPSDTLFFVYNYPVEQAVLAMVDQRDHRVARRFELYYKNVELANGFQELADPEENSIRMQEENRKRETLGKPLIPIDQEFIESLCQQFPPCSGVALGLDRLIMSVGNFSTISQVVSFARAGINRA